MRLIESEPNSNCSEENPKVHFNNCEVPKKESPIIFPTIKGLGELDPSDFIEQEPWYRNSYFPLLPIVEYKEEEPGEIAYLQFKWLLLTIYSTMYFHLSFEITLDAEGFCVVVRVPYFDITVGLPIPLPIQKYLFEKTTRFPKDWGKS